MIVRGYFSARKLPGFSGRSLLQFSHEGHEVRFEGRQQGVFLVFHENIVVVAEIKPQGTGR
jgi:hypothetical protein